MKIIHIGHSCFLLCAKNGATVLTDPYGDVGILLPQLNSDIVTVSHSHYDHCNVSAVGGQPVILKDAGSFCYNGIEIQAIESFHDDAEGRKRGRNLIFSLLIDGLRVTHLGDLGEKFGESSLRRIPRSDILLIPVGGNYTIDGDEAARYVKALSPSIVIPMHYYVRGLTVDIEDEKRFIKAMGGNYRREAALEVVQADLTQQTQLIVLENHHE